MPVAPTLLDAATLDAATLDATDVAGPAAETSPLVPALSASLLLFPRGGRATPGDAAPAAPAGSFVAAVGRCLEADGALMAMVGGAVGGGAPRKIWLKLAPPRTPPPWVVFLVAGEDRGYTSTSGDFIHMGILQVSAFATGEAVAEAVADRAAAALMAGWAAGSVTWTSGVLIQLRTISPLSTVPPAAGAGSGRVWQAIRQLKFRWFGNDAGIS